MPAAALAAGPHSPLQGHSGLLSELLPWAFPLCQSLNTAERVIFSFQKKSGNHISAVLEGPRSVCPSEQSHDLTKAGYVLHSCTRVPLWFIHFFTATHRLWRPELLAVAPGPRCCSLLSVASAWNTLPQGFRGSLPHSLPLFHVTFSVRLCVVFLFPAAIPLPHFPILTLSPMLFGTTE